MSFSSKITNQAKYDDTGQWSVSLQINEVKEETGQQEGREG
jgi:hypothetical protein